MRAQLAELLDAQTAWKPSKRSRIGAGGSQIMEISPLAALHLEQRIPAE